MINSRRRQLFAYELVVYLKSGVIARILDFLRGGRIEIELVETGERKKVTRSDLRKIPRQYYFKVVSRYSLLNPVCQCGQHYVVMTQAQLVDRKCLDCLLKISN